jgi:hypothetical protein
MTAPGFLDATVDSTVEMPVDAEIYPRVAPVWPQTILSQYANSPRILALIESFSDAINADGLSDIFLNSILSVDTATGYGLDVWGRIVNVRRTLYVPGGASGKLLGWGEPGPAKFYGWRQAPWNTLNRLTPNYTLQDDDYRRLILVKAFSNISDRSIPSMNAGLMQMFAGQGNVHVSDLGNMTAAYVFDFHPTALDLAILQQSGAFASPSGVLMSIVTP